MRAIGQLPDEASARRFSDYLLVQGLPNQVEVDDNGRWTLWIHEDDHLAQAQTLLAEFLQQPADRKYCQAAPAARELREKEVRDQQAWRKRLFERGSLWRGGEVRLGWFTATLTAICVTVAVVKFMQGPDSPLIRALQITEYPVGDGFYIRGLPEVRSGQVWRVVTPVLLHFGIFHLLFNMLWLLDLGSLVESRQSAFRLAIKVVLLASVSNLAQYWVGGPAFGGMSGVVYGLFGYIWVRGKVDPRSRFHLDPTSVTLMIIWFFACMAGLVGPVANMAHASGLGLGLVWGYLAGKLNQGE